MSREKTRNEVDQDLRDDITQADSWEARVELLLTQNIRISKSILAELKRLNLQGQVRNG